MGGCCRTKARALIAALLAAVPGSADMISDEGMEPWEVCAMCHGLDGVSAMARFPKLAGQPAAYLEKQIQDFRAGRRTNDGGQMVSIAGELAEHEIPAVAAWFAGQPPPTPSDSPGPDGATLYADAGCDSCHGSDAAVPYLTAQHAAYLAKQMRDFVDGRRDNAPKAAKPGRLADLAPREIDAIAAYLAATPRAP